MTTFIKRVLQWEFWPIWAIYLPLLPYLLFLAARHRSLTLFTLANPGIPAGGLAGESKSAILEHLNSVPGVVPSFTLIPESLSPSGRVSAAKLFMTEAGHAYPIVLKPDVGERGVGVCIARSSQDLERYLWEAGGDTILQRFAPGEEFGLYYVRHPEEAAGHVLYITGKHFPSVTGDGMLTLRDLILADPRARCIAQAYFRAAKRPLNSIPTRGERVPLVEIGTHSRGAIFLNASSLMTPALNAAVDRVSRAHPGFHLGRYDVKAASASALSRGEFQVLELNGVSGEATHIYDPSVPLAQKYRVMARHWRTAFEIGAAHRAHGATPLGVLELWRIVLPRRSPRPLHPQLV